MQPTTIERLRARLGEIMMLVLQDRSVERDLFADMKLSFPDGSPKCFFKEEKTEILIPPEIVLETLKENCATFGL